MTMEYQLQRDDGFPVEESNDLSDALAWFQDRVFLGETSSVWRLPKGSGEVHLIATFPGMPKG